MGQRLSARYPPVFFWLKKTGLAQGRPKNLPTYLGCMLPSDKNFPSWCLWFFFPGRGMSKTGNSRSGCVLRRCVRWARAGGASCVFNGTNSAPRHRGPVCAGLSTAHLGPVTPPAEVWFFWNNFFCGNFVLQKSRCDSLQPRLGIRPPARLGGAMRRSSANPLPGPLPLGR